MASRRELRIAVDMLVKEDGLTAVGKLVDLLRYHPIEDAREVIASIMLSKAKAGEKKNTHPAHDERRMNELRNREVEYRDEQT